MYKIQYFDTDCESWFDVDEIPPCQDKYTAEQEAKHWKSRLCGKTRTRVVKE